jgi:hypothetical protein
MEALVEHLEVAKKEVGRAAMISYIEPWPKRNAMKKEIKVKNGDYVVLHQQVHVPGAATKLTTSWNGPWRVVGKRQKEFEVVHIVSGKRTWKHVTNLTSAPDPAHSEDYNDQYEAAVQRIDPVDRVPTEHELLEDVLRVVNMEGRNAIAKVMQVFQDGSAMVQWWNTRKLDSTSTAAYFPGCGGYTPDSELGGTASVKGEMPLWEIVQRRDMAVVFVFAANCPRTKERLRVAASGTN